MTDAAAASGDTVQVSQYVLPGQRVTPLLGDGSVKIGAAVLCCSLLACAPLISQRSSMLPGAGLRREEDEVYASAGGLLYSRMPKRYWVESNSKRVSTPPHAWFPPVAAPVTPCTLPCAQYAAAVNDTVIGIVSDKGAESYRLHIGGPTAANLSAIAFDGATKRNKPNLMPGTLVFARVESADRDLEPEVTCKASGASGEAAAHKKDWVTGQGMYGELKGGTVVQVSMQFCRQCVALPAALPLPLPCPRLTPSRPVCRLLLPTCAVLSALAAAVPYEVAVGMNGVVWVHAASVAHTILIANAIQLAEHVPDDDIPALVRRLLERVG